MSISALTGRSDGVEALVERALALCRAGQFPEAEHFLRRALEVEPRHFAALHFLGVVRSQLGDHVDALRHLESALRIDAKSADVNNSRGNVLAALKRFEEALADFERAIALD